MADFSAPSFSLGLDLDVGADPDLSTEEEQPADGDGGRRGDPEEEGSPPAGPSSSGRHPWGDKEEDENDLVLETLEEEDPPPPSAPLKRLRRGPPPRGTPEAPRPRLAEPSATDARVRRLPVVDDGVEALSSQEDCVIRDEYSSRQDHSACSSTSRFSLHGQRTLTTYARKLKVAKPIPPSNGSVPICLEANNNKKVLRRLISSPLRRIQLVDSDLDDLSNCGDKHNDVIEVDACHKNQFASVHSVAKAQWETTEISSGKLQRENFWKDFTPKKNINLATPALDEFCEEYFIAVKSSNIDLCSKEQSHQTTITSSSMCAPDVDGTEARHEECCISDSPEHNWNLPNPQPPSYQYFYHGDVRIQKLVRQRLPYFVPLGDVKCMPMQQSNAATLDYMSQFGQGEVPFQVSGAREKELEGNSKCRSRKQKNTKGKKVADASGPWVNPRSSNTLPKDARKRLVHAAKHSSGHWYTGQDGRKVYVTRNGQELSGRIAYRHYRKESGAGFRKSRKKAATAKRKRKR